jgi:uncharacterized membrane protein
MPSPPAPPLRMPPPLPVAAKEDFAQVERPADSPPLLPESSWLSRTIADMFTEWMEQSGLNWEMLLGTRGIVWLGMSMVLVGSAFFLRYFYNVWLGPEGRLCLGVCLGCIVLGIGEYFRRKRWAVLHQTFTGGGLAIFYVCVFFAFGVYHLIGASVAMGFGVAVTLFGVTLAVLADGMSIAILAVLGGFLSPVLFSTGGNHPYALFTYVIVLDLVAFGAASFRRWRPLDLLCYTGTFLLYTAWVGQYYDQSQLTPALLFNSIFYLLFLIIPSLHGLVRQRQEDYQGLALMAANATASLVYYYVFLYRDYPHALGGIVIGQAAIAFLLFEAYALRLRKDALVTQCLLVLTLTLATLAVPLQLRFYGIPIAWAVEAVVFAWLGLRLQQIVGRIAACVGLGVATVGLCNYLPLHHAAFIPVFNVPFGSWLVVIAAALAVMMLLRRQKEFIVPEEAWLPFAPMLLAIGLGGLLVSMETFYFWAWRGFAAPLPYQQASLLVLWVLIALLIAVVIEARGWQAWHPLVWAAFGVALLFFLMRLTITPLASKMLIFNLACWPELMFILALWAVTYGLHSIPDEVRNGMRLAGHTLLALMLAVELERWGGKTDVITYRLAISLISGVWALQAYLLIWLGLQRRFQPVRILGFALFALAIAKVILYDTGQLGTVYRIVSWMACGVLLLITGYVYQRYRGEIAKEQEGVAP